MKLMYKILQQTFKTLADAIESLECVLEDEHKYVFRFFLLARSDDFLATLSEEVRRIHQLFWPLSGKFQYW